MPVAPRRLVATSALLLVISFAALGCGGGSGPDIALVYTFNAGDTWAHEISTTVDGATQGLGDAEPEETHETTKTRVTSRVESVSPEGIATIAVTTETLEMVQNGEIQDLSLLMPQTATVTMDSTGRILSTQGAGDAAAGLVDSGSFLNPTDLGGQLSTLMFPTDGTVKAGEEWTGTSAIPLAGLGKELTVTTKAKLLGVSTDNGAQVATVEYVTTLPMDLELDLGTYFSAMFGSSDDGSSLDLVFKMATKGVIQFGGTATIDLATGQAVVSDADGTIGRLDRSHRSARAVRSQGSTRSVRLGDDAEHADQEGRDAQIRRWRRNPGRPCEIRV